MLSGVTLCTCLVTAIPPKVLILTGRAQLYNSVNSSATATFWEYTLVLVFSHNHRLSITLTKPQMSRYKMSNTSVIELYQLPMLVYNNLQHQTTVTHNICPQWLPTCNIKQQIHPMLVHNGFKPQSIKTRLLLHDHSWHWFTNNPNVISHKRGINIAA